jgi:hypothetical protein
MLVEDRADAGRVALAHLIDTEGQMNRDQLLGCESGQQRMLGAAGAAVLGEYKPEVCSIGISSVG